MNSTGNEIEFIKEYMNKTADTIQRQSAVINAMDATITEQEEKIRLLTEENARLRRQGAH